MFWPLQRPHRWRPEPDRPGADNDLAVGKIVDTISHSKYWKSSAIFVIEDDTQNGVDHVDGARGPVEVISPWAQHRTVDSRYYSQITVIRTIEQILGMQPMNQKDSAATPMTHAFTNKPDYAKYTARPNRIPLTYGVDTTPTCGTDQVAAKFAKLAPSERKALTVPQDMTKMAQNWKTWTKSQRLTGARAVPDYANPQQMDHYTWYEAHGYRTPYPGEKQVLSPAQVPGRYLPSPDFDG